LIMLIRLISFESVCTFWIVGARWYIFISFHFISFHLISSHLLNSQTISDHFPISNVLTF
jgi:hypothetical protein